MEEVISSGCLSNSFILYYFVMNQNALAQTLARKIFSHYSTGPYLRDDDIKRFIQDSNASIHRYYEPTASDV